MPAILFNSSVKIAATLLHLFHTLDSIWDLLDKKTHPSLILGGFPEN